MDSKSNTATQQYSIAIEQQLNISPGNINFQVQDQQIIGNRSMVVTVTGNAQNKPVTLTQTQDWIVATIQTASAGATPVCCPTTINASVDPYAFRAQGAYTGALGISVEGFRVGTIGYSVEVLPPRTPTPRPFDASVQLKSVANAASFGPDVAVGSLVSLFGTGMAGGTYSAAKLPLPTSLGDVTVAVCPTNDGQLLNCVATPLVYASPTQINFVAPNSPANQDRLITVFRAGHDPARPLSFRLLTAAPALFLVGYDCSYNPLWSDPSPCGIDWTHYSNKQPLRGAVTGQDGSLMTSANPTRYGQQYTLWLTGLGVFANSQPPVPVSIRVSGTPTDAFYAVRPSYVGPSLQFLGLYQINFPWPDGMMGSIENRDIQACADYRMEISFNISQGTKQDPNVVQVPLLVKNGDVPCLSR
jgi:uncharacterized protein (TIGR03437 family)